ncbi:all trans-polyprenyl-diphosphate synthase PDSS2-like isoform X2 [Ostrea edulis]|uniref:all trans-polyprenyl-diphosphate synthase PDSS2-like isoform X2 n=1 Tax=Ostrea edulis TaxID=37623 RepID=UPI0024AF04E6|nr:all trans-polyprenyl-diphosphate synthase PDSS2-like isoform X2 [Ostrea edulis]
MKLCKTCLTFLHHCTRINVPMRAISGFSSKTYDDWNKAVSDAEKIVGYPTSYMSLRCLISDEFSNVAMHLRKLVGTRHPLLKTARGLLYDGKQSTQTRGLIVLLIAKAAGPGPSELSKTREPDKVSGIYSSQRSLAEATEMIHTANLIHKGVVNLAEFSDSEDREKNDMEFGNKMAVLSGDFLLANACTELASLNNTKVVETMSFAITDLMEAEFTDLRDSGGECVLKRDIQFSDWIRQTYLSSGSLLARGCRSAVELADHTEDQKEAAASFGENMAYLQQMKTDLKPLFSRDNGGDDFSVTSAPVIKYLEQTPEERDRITALSTKDAQQIVSSIKTASVIDECYSLCYKYGDSAKKSLDVFPQTDAKSALINIVNATIRS